MKSLEEAEAGCEVETGGEQRYGVAAEHRAAAAFVSARLGSLADEARRFFPHERAITHKEPKTVGVVAPVPKGARSEATPKGVVVSVPQGARSAPKVQVSRRSSLGGSTST